MKHKKRYYEDGGVIDILSTLAPLADLAIPGLGTAAGAALQVMDKMITPQSFAPKMIKDTNPYSYATGGTLSNYGQIMSTKDKPLSSTSIKIQGNPQVVDGNPRRIDNRNIRLDHNEIVSKDTIKGTYALSPNLLNPKTGNTLAKDGEKLQKIRGEVEKYLTNNPKDSFAMNTREFADYLYNKLVLENERQLRENPNIKTVEQTSYQGGGPITPDTLMDNSGSTSLFVGSNPYTNTPGYIAGNNPSINQDSLVGPKNDTVWFDMGTSGLYPVPKPGKDLDPYGYNEDLFKGANPFLPETRINYMPSTAPIYPPEKTVKPGVGYVEQVTQLEGGRYIPGKTDFTYAPNNRSQLPTKTLEEIDKALSDNPPKIRGKRTRKGARYPNKIQITNYNKVRVGDTNIPKEIDVREFQQWVKDNGAGVDLGKAGVDNRLGPKTRAAWKKYGQQFLDSKYGQSLESLSSSPSDLTSTDTNLPSLGDIRTPEKKGKKGFKARLDNIGDVLQGISALSRFLDLSPERERFNRVPMNQIDVEPYIQDIQRLSRANRNIGRSYTFNRGINQGAYADALNQTNRVRASVNQVNTQLRNQINAANTSIANQEIIANAQNQAAADRAKQVAFAQLGVLGQAFNNKRSAMEALDYMAEAYPDVYDYLMKAVQERNKQ